MTTTPALDRQLVSIDLRTQRARLVADARALAVALAVAVALPLGGCGGSDTAVAASAAGAGGGPITGSGGGTGNGTGTGAGTGSGGSSTGSAGPSGCEVATPSDPLEVATIYGAVRGKKDGDVLAFLGIPYAAPPVGDLRFHAPESPACWEGVRDMIEYGNACVQNLPTGGAAGEEDCLYLNVWTPSKSGPPRPVLFFVHGGALLFGSGSQDLLFEGTGNLYRGQALADERDVVVVTINYRLAELGFLAHPTLSEEDAHGSSGNYGTLDQIAALRWVKDNIAAFGGDPGRVMLFGESAGGLSTCLLVGSPLAKGLFSSAIMESGGCVVAPRASRYSQGASIVDGVGCTDANDVPACLRSKSADAFRISPPSGMSLFVFNDIQRAWEMPYGPNVDGYVFPEPPMATIRKGNHNKVPLAVGSNATEFDIFIPIGTVNTCADYWSLVGVLFGGHADEVLSHYSCFDYALPRFAAIGVGTDFMFTCPARRVARAAQKGGSPSVYRYYYPHAYSNSPLTALRAFHAAELPFVFRTFDVLGYEPTAGDVALSKAMAGYWTRFAAAGDPNDGAAFLWPLYDAATDKALVLDDELSTKAKIAESRCDFWDTIAAE
jgi:para-nitrobenzyl esterase